MVTISFDKGTLLLDDCPAVLKGKHGITWDERVRLWRGEAYRYRKIVMDLHESGHSFCDTAKLFERSPFFLAEKIQPRPYQKNALQAWLSGGQEGVVVLPTGAGKTILAVLCIEKTARPALIHVPTIDLMHQWHATLKKFFKAEIGLLGGGYNDIRPITVSTYESALIHINRIGAQFGLLVFDECHHLPSSQLQHVATCSIAPFRLGLTATPERTDGMESRLFEICGPKNFEITIGELEGKTLANYDIETIELEMYPQERAEYERARATYVSFLREENIDMGGYGGWQKFLYESSKTPEGRHAFQCYLKQKRLSQNSKAKEDYLFQLFQKHLDERILVFTQENQAAYAIGERYGLPVLTHHTKVKERESFLKNFRSGDYRILVTSKVLNEGVDVPEASVAVVVSGSGTVREHVQRLGRILRAVPGKKAKLYELVSMDTSEHHVNKRRKQHSAYQKTPSV